MGKIPTLYMCDVLLLKTKVVTIPRYIIKTRKKNESQPKRKDVG